MFQSVYFGNPVYGNTYNFKVSRYASDGFIHLLLENAPPSGPACDATHLCVTAFDPLVVWPGTNSQWFAETKHPGDDVAGTSAIRTDFNQTKVKRPNDTWANLTFDTGTPPSFCYYHAQQVTTDSHFEVWTAPPAHNC